MPPRRRVLPLPAGTTTLTVLSIGCHLDRHGRFGNGSAPNLENRNEPENPRTREPENPSEPRLCRLDWRTPRQHALHLCLPFEDPVAVRDVELVEVRSA